MFPIISGAINHDLKDVDIKSNIGKRVLACLWLAAVFAFVSFIFWLMSICCCSGRSPYGHKDTRRSLDDEKPSSYTYDRVGPFGGHVSNGSQSAVPLTSMAANDGATAYEPYRHA